jgi:flavin-dependent thymidylate synthase
MRGKSPEDMTDSERYEHFQYMLDTIKSPFEFVDYIFEITEVSKNFTHQLVRTRTGAYQQETSRALEVTETVRPDAFEHPKPFEGYHDDAMTEAFVKQSSLAEMFDDAVADANAHYRQLIQRGAALQDARAVLPSNMQTAIKAKFNLRTMSDMAKNRLCARTQGEYQQAYRLMRAAVLAVHPWADPLLQVACVATGQCAFPRWGGKVLNPNDLGDLAEIERRGGAIYQCPHYRPWMDLSKQKEELRISFWSRDEIAQANPVAKDGKSM